MKNLIGRRSSEWVVVVVKKCGGSSANQISQRIYNA